MSGRHTARLTNDTRDPMKGDHDMPVITGRRSFVLAMLAESAISVSACTAGTTSATGDATSTPATSAATTTPPSAQMPASTAAPMTWPVAAP
jgi:hypothetical protein